MLIIDEDSVYEIDEACVAKRCLPPECGILEKIAVRELPKFPKDPGAPAGSPSASRK